MAGDPQTYRRMWNGEEEDIGGPPMRPRSSKRKTDEDGVCTDVLATVLDSEKRLKGKEEGGGRRAKKRRRSKGKEEKTVKPELRRSQRFDHFLC